MTILHVATKSCSRCPAHVCKCVWGGRGVITFGTTWSGFTWGRLSWGVPAETRDAAMHMAGSHGGGGATCTETRDRCRQLPAACLMGVLRLMLRLAGRQGAAAAGRGWWSACAADRHGKANSCLHETADCDDQLVRGGGLCTGLWCRLWQAGQTWAGHTWVLACHWAKVSLPAEERRAALACPNRSCRGFCFYIYNGT